MAGFLFVMYEWTRCPGSAPVLIAPVRGPPTHLESLAA